MRVERLAQNLGFSAGNNAGARLARGKWLVLLNADAFPQPDWLAELVAASQANPAFSTFSSRQLQAGNPETLDGAGDAYHVSGMAWRIGLGYPSDKYVWGSRKYSAHAELRRCTRAKPSWRQAADSAANAPYLFSVEVQIFPIESYRRTLYDAHFASHTAYKKRQFLNELLPLLFPPGIYGGISFLTADAVPVPQR